MAAIGNKYDTAAEPSAGFDTMPEHECVAQVIESDCKLTSKGDGEYISLRWQILDGEFKNRILFSNFNIRNPNAVCQQIGNAEFAAVRIALFGSKDKVVNDTAELHNLPCRIKVGCRKRKDTGEMENHIKKYTSLNSHAAAVADPHAVKKPWE